MPNTPSKGQHGAHKSGATPEKDMKANPSNSGKPSGSQPDVSRSSPPHTNKPQETHKSGEHRRP